MEKTGSKYPKLEALATTVGGDVLAEFEAMRLAAENDAQRERTLAACERTLARIGRLVAGLDHVSADDAETSPVSAATATATAIGHEQDPEPASTIRNLEASYQLLCAAALGEKALDDAKQGIVRAKGWNRKKDRNRRVGGLLACTMGGFRGEFVRRATTGLDKLQRDIVLQELATIYSKITGARVTVAKLKAEAKAAALANEARVLKILTTRNAK